MRRSWTAISIDVCRSGRHHPFCLFLVLEFFVFAHLVGWLVGWFLRQKTAERGLSVCLTWACPALWLRPYLQDDVFHQPASHTGNILVHKHSLCGTDSLSTDPAAEGQTRILLRRVRSRHAARPLRVGRKETFYRDPVISHKAVVSRGGTERCLI